MDENERGSYENMRSRLDASQFPSCPSPEFHPGKRLPCRPLEGVLKSVTPFDVPFSLPTAQKRK
jgi:hypothetical protein